MKPAVMVSAVFGATAVAAGAFGAHALEASVTPERLQVWNTAAQYHLIHAAVILALALHSQPDNRQWRWPIMGVHCGRLTVLILAVCAGAHRYHAPGDDYALGRVAPDAELVDGGDQSN